MAVIAAILTHIIMDMYFLFHVVVFVATDSDVPELLPIGYLVGDTTQIGICLKGNAPSRNIALWIEVGICLKGKTPSRNVALWVEVGICLKGNTPSRNVALWVEVAI